MIVYARVRTGIDTLGNIVLDDSLLFMQHNLRHSEPFENNIYSTDLAGFIR